jgi:ferredoxin-NADP reductase/predicted pyridoxine 5'-phosphate oxidase superfamily flavin-nucleotide-binding protein
MRGNIMAHKYVKIAFTPTVRAVQERHNSRDGYASMDQGEDYNHQLSQHEADFLAQRDSFYMASVSETNWPYVQHRGGPKGFMRVIDATTIGFADFSGNRQYVSTGNFKTNDRVSLFFMDYPNRRRLKMMGRVEQVSDQDWEMLAKLEVDGYRATVERGFIIKIEGFDWNCPQHITPRFTEDEVEQVIAPTLQEIERLTEENKQLKAKINSADIRPIESQVPAQLMSLGQGALSLIITGIRQLTPSVRAYELRNKNGEALPAITAGSHLKIPVQLDNGQMVSRHYSICSNPKRTDVYEIAVLNNGFTKDNAKDNEKGSEQASSGSQAIHNSFQLGRILNVEKPANYFQLHEDQRPAVLIAAGIGITPIKSMAQALECRKVQWHMHYAGQSLTEMAFQDRLKRVYPEQLSIYSKADKVRMDIAVILQQAPETAVFYVCGPNKLIDDVMDQANLLGIKKQRIVFERFVSASTLATNVLAKSITVRFLKSGKTINVLPDKSILDAAIEAGISPMFSCKTGQCKTCAVKVIDGDAQHQDECLSEHEQETQKLMCPCVSRSEHNNITLDL